MLEKTPKKPARSIQYLLSADRRLHKLSLRKIAGAANKSKQPRSNRVKSAAGQASSPGFSAVLDHWVIVFGVLAVVGGVVMVAARQPSMPAALESVEVQPEIHRPARQAAMAARVDSVETSAVNATATSPAVKRGPNVAAATPPPAAHAASVRITGCLELDEKTFWLKDVSGVDAPKARSWRSGFLKKRPPSIELVDDTHMLRLSNHVGQRVEATGTLTKREMQARSLTQVAASCN